MNALSIRLVLYPLALLCIVAGSMSAEVELDLSRAVVVAPADFSGPENKAAQMLIEEVEKRTQLRWLRVNQAPSEGSPFISINRAAIKGGSKAPLAREGYQIKTVGKTVSITGNDARGVLFGVGHLLRMLRMTKRKITLPDGFNITTSPKYPLRGHQLGFRPKTNSYDGWTLPMWEQYIRDLAVFGTNAVELIPPRSDDAADSPHFPLPQIEMMIGMSRICDEYGLDVWIWYPALDQDYSKPETVEFALTEWGEVFKQLPRIDAILVPGGDPGHTQPKYLMALLEKQTENLRRHHPKAQMWVAPQGFSQEWMDEFLSIVKTEPKWLTGVVYGPQCRLPLPKLREALPAKMPIRHYPDITHSRHSQFAVPDWDTAYALTEAREIINPRPTQMATVFRLYQPYTLGFIAYSEGCNDDVNKMMWSALGWNRDANVSEILRDYSRHFISAAHADRFAEGLLMLEKNWEGPLQRNESVEKTLRHFQDLEREATPQEKLNWRFQQALYRAYYDAYLRRRLIYEGELEEQAIAKLRNAPVIGSLAAITNAENSLNRFVAESVAMELRSRVFELAEALFQSIRMQLSVPKYQAIALERGANLDAIDVPLNSRVWLKKQFAAIAAVNSEAGRLGRIKQIVDWKNPGPGGFYDDLGDSEQQPHLVRGRGAATDPAFFESSLASFIRNPRPEWPMSWWHWAESLYDQPLQLRYTGLDPAARYKVRVVYGSEGRATKIRLMANDAEIHPYLNKPFERLEYELPPASTRSGNLLLSWNQEPGSGGNGRGCAVAEVWLIKQSDEK